MSRKSLNDMLEDYYIRNNYIIDRRDFKTVLRDWLKDVGLPDYVTDKGINATKEIRELLIMLVDEP